MPWTPIQFGKYRGQTLPQLVFTDPDWFFAAYAAGSFDTSPALRVESALVFQRARNIRIPGDQNRPMVAEYVFLPSLDRFSHFHIMDQCKVNQNQSASVIRKPIIDMAIPWERNPFDHYGCRQLLLSMKLYIFGSRTFAVKRELAERFIDDESNFLLATERLSTAF